MEVRSSSLRTPTSYLAVDSETSPFVHCLDTGSRGRLTLNAIISKKHYCFLPWFHIESAPREIYPLRCLGGLRISAGLSSAMPGPLWISSEGLNSRWERSVCSPTQRSARAALTRSGFRLVGKRRVVALDLGAVHRQAGAAHGQSMRSSKVSGFLVG